MSTEATKSPPAPAPAPESPTTARPLEMDDDDVQETEVAGAKDSASAAAGTATTTTSSGPGASNDEAPPPKPPRPLTEEQKKQQTLKEAFPTVEDAVIRAVLRASGGRIEAAFNALLEMTDPDAVAREQEQVVEEQPPPQPPRPTVHPTGGALSQVEADELYARQLAQHYENVSAYEARTANRSPHGYRAAPGAPRPPSSRDEFGSEREHSFIEDDLPVIKESLRKGFLETQTKVNAWFNNLKKKIDETFDDDDDEEERRRQGGGSFLGRPTRDQQRRSADYDRYDADPELLSDDFAGMKFHADGTPVRDQRPFAGSNPNLFKPPPPAPSKSPRPDGARKAVSFSDTVDEIDAYQAAHRAAFGPGPKRATSPSVGGGSATTTAGSGAAGSGGAGVGAKSSKWQPLSPVDPNPMAEAENDPFSLGDSDDERDSAKPAPAGGIKMEDAERLKQATADAMAESIVEGGSGKGGKDTGSGGGAK
ncbi:hypothetical protein VTJ04DRAFT_8765 [Mycothermus thermophilus]|uniref:uncharacterized protein n=1 Tax=Humicola insolens TaxID=85995 RepID=UPI0037427AC6